MSCIFSISSNFFKKNATTPIIYTAFNMFSGKNLKASWYSSNGFGSISTQMMGQAHDPVDIPDKSPLEYKPGVPPEMPQTPNVPDFDPIPPEKPADPPPLSPGPNPGPEFPGPPNPSPPKPEAPEPPMPSPPGEPEVIPPHGPDVVPPKPPEPGPPNPTQPDILPPIMGSDGLVFFY